MKTKQQVSVAAWRARNPKSSTHWAHKLRRTNIARHFYWYIKGRATKQKRAFNLTEEWIAAKIGGGECEQTGLAFVITEYKNPFLPSVDRINTSKGYTIDNCQVVCLMYNLAKNVWSDKDVWTFIKNAKEPLR